MENFLANIAYIHRLNANELGIRRGQARGAGRFFLVAKTCVSFFPPLSEVMLNDHVLLSVIPPFANEPVLTNYVYRNSKHATLDENEDRDEYRIYLNSANDPDHSFYHPNDIVVFVKIVPPDAPEGLTYKLFKYAEGDREYSQLASLLASADPRRGTHAVVALNEVTFLGGLSKITIGKKIIPKEILEEAFREPVEHAPVTEEDKYETTRVVRSRSFRDLILYFYEDKCAITGSDLVIEHKEFKNLEAAHILARASGGGSHPSNGLALERNLHWAFDKGFFTLTKDFKVDVHANAQKIPYLKSKHGLPIFLPQDSRSRPNQDSMAWHRKNVFGMFMNGDV